MHGFYPDRNSATDRGDSANAFMLRQSIQIFNTKIQDWYKQRALAAQYPDWYRQRAAQLEASVERNRLREHRAVLANVIGRFERSTGKEVRGNLPEV
jgi:hypothetical protein